MKTLSKSRSNKPFTLIELIAAMGVFAIIMVIVMSVFTAANRAWANCRDRGEVYENARVAMDLISRDIQCIYYEYRKVPFYHSTTSGPNANEALFFTSATSIRPGAATSKICEVAYSFYNVDTSGCKAGHLIRSVTADNTPAKWNYYNTPALSKVFANSDATYAFTQDSTSKEAYNPVIPNVVSLSFNCLKRDGTLIVPAATPEMFPYSIVVNLTLLDSGSWAKWIAKSGDTSNPAGDPPAAKTFREENQRKFSKTIIIGERNQQY
ncbi:MAG: prepilin-type N-terminal cleavage/methylation domain-containing protein [Victivallales bacterium]